MAASQIEFACLATSCRYADPEKNDEMIKNTHLAIDLAGDIGAPRIRVFGGPLGAGLSRESAQELVAKALSSVADHAGERNVILTCEVHDDWCDPKDWVPVMQAVHHPAIAINWDIMHPVRVADYTIEESFKVLKPWIKHVHFHDGNILENGGVELKPAGEGIVDHKRAVELLQENGYTDFLSGEWINWTSYEEHLPRELAIMKSYEK
jgi:sugar phosphate isomerase/epimerase